jgi:hypothetical protein
MSIRAEQTTGHPTGNVPELRYFPQNQPHKCPYRCGAILRSEPEYRNHLTAFHTWGGPKENPNGVYLAPDGMALRTLPEKLAYMLNKRNDPFTQGKGGTGATFTTEKALKAHEYARRFKRSPGSFIQVPGSK